MAHRSTKACVPPVTFAEELVKNCKTTICFFCPTYTYMQLSWWKLTYRLLIVTAVYVDLSPSSVSTAALDQQLPSHWAQGQSSGLFCVMQAQLQPTLPSQVLSASGSAPIFKGKVHACKQMSATELIPAGHHGEGGWPFPKQGARTEISWQSKCATVSKTAMSSKNGCLTISISFLSVGLHIRCTEISRKTLTSSPCPRL